MAAVVPPPRKGSWNDVTDQSKDRIEGTIDEATGRVKSATGELTGDQDLKGEGELDQMVGKAKQGLADAKDKVDDLVKKVTGN